MSVENTPTENMNKRVSDAEGFWDISSLVPERARRSPRVQNTDTTTVIVDIGGEPTRAGEAIPERRDAPKESEEKPTVEYDGDGALCRVKISPWPTKFTFYSRFAAQAAALWRKKHAKCDAVGFFSYMPQYEQMTTAQLKYYLYWRDLVRHGEYPPVDCSYVLLYLYEIINLPKLIPAPVGAKLIALVWAAYRGAYPYLDKYAGEWLCDYCMIYRTPVPTEIVSPFLSDAAPKLAFPEYLSKDGGADFDLVKAVSSYDYKKSKYYAACKAEFDEHIPAAAKAGCDALFEGGIYGSVPPVRITRDSFSGAVAHCDVKFRMEIMYRSPSRSRAVRDAVTAIIKLCENNIRMEKGIKSRFLKISLPDGAARAVNAYFDAVYPERSRRKKRDPDSEEYMKLYEPTDVGSADIARAMKIENDAWQTAIELDGGNIVYEDEAPTAAPSAPIETDDGFSDFVSSLDAELFALLKAALDGKFTAACAAMRISPAEAERRINELSFDLIGDAVISGGVVIEDYRDDITSRIDMNGG